MTAPECCKVGAARTQRRRLSVRTASRLAAAGCSGCRRPVPRESDGVGLRLRPKASTHTRQACAGGPNRRWATAVAHRDRQAPIQSNPFRTAPESETYCPLALIPRRARRQPRGESGRQCAIVGHRDAGPSCLHAGSATSAPHTDQSRPCEQRSAASSRVYRRRYRAPTASTADRSTDLLSRCTSMPLASTPSLTTRTMSAPR